MWAAVISGVSSVIVGTLSLIGVISTNKRMRADMLNEIKIAQAVSDTKIDELTREVRMHNNFAARMPVVEEQVKVMNHRIKDLEEKK